MIELQDYLELMAKQPREWHGEESPELKIFSAHTVPSGGVILKPLDMPAFVDAVAQVDPRATMNAFPEALRRWHVDTPEAIRRSIGETFFAWVVRTESFALKLTEDLPDREERIRMANARQIDKHPDRVEIRDWSAASADGTLFSVMAERESGEVRKSRIIRPGDDVAKQASRTINSRNLIRAARVTEWALGRWPRR